MDNCIDIQKVLQLLFVGTITVGGILIGKSIKKANDENSKIQAHFQELERQEKMWKEEVQASLAYLKEKYDKATSKREKKRIEKEIRKIAEEVALRAKVVLGDSFIEDYLKKGGD